MVRVTSDDFWLVTLAFGSSNPRSYFTLSRFSLDIELVVGSLVHKNFDIEPSDCFLTITNLSYSCFKASVGNFTELARILSSRLR